MIAPVALLALSLWAMNESLQVPPGKMIVVPVQVPHDHARLECHFMLMSTGSGVRVYLVDAEASRAMEQQKPFAALASTDFAQKGLLRHRVSRGRYVLVLDNHIENRFWAEVNFRIKLEPEPPPRYASPVRRTVVIALSALFLFGTLGYTWTRFREALPHRRGQPPPAPYA